MGELSKICSRCGVRKLTQEYHKDNKSPDGLCYVCKECEKVRMKRWRALHKWWITIDAEQYFKEHKKERYEYYLEHLEERRKYGREYYYRKKSTTK